MKHMNEQQAEMVFTNMLSIFYSHKHRCMVSGDGTLSRERRTYRDAAPAQIHKPALLVVGKVSPTKRKRAPQSLHSFSLSTVSNGKGSLKDNVRGDLSVAVKTAN